MTAALAVLGLLAVAAVCLLVAIDLAVRPAIAGARHLAFGCVGAALWASGYAAEIQQDTLPGMVAAARIEYVGIVLSALFLYLGIAEHTGTRPLGRRLRLLACALPVATVGIAVTNDAHHLLWRDFRLVDVGDGLVLLEPTYGPWFFVHIAWTYVLLALSAALIVRATRASGSTALKAALIAVAAPWLGNAIYLSGLTTIDVTPFCVGAGAVGLAVALQRHELFASGARDGDAFRVLVETADDVVFTASLDGRLRTLNRAGRELFGIASEAVPARRVRDLAAVEDDGPLLRDLLVDDDAHEDVTVVAPSGEARALEIRARQVATPDGDVYVHGIARDVTERRQQEAELARRMHHDDLTGLPNRTLLRERLGHAALGALGGRPFALAIVDVDGFKDINGRYGQAAGDALLRELASRLELLLRDADVLARLGGDEFAVILRDIDDPAVADEVGRRILDVVGAPFTLRGSQQVIGASVGIALAPTHGTDPHALLHCAELAMRSAKDAKVGVEVYRRALEARAADRLTLADDLRRALAEDAIDVVYQPQVALYDGRTVGIEALARWNHPQRGPIPTERFVRLAEDTGLVGQLDQVVLARALGDLATLQTTHPLQLAVNLSARDLADPRLAERIAAATELAGVDPRSLTIELTESTVMRDPAHDGAILRRLRDAGACVAIDDFGTGYSSLAYLSELPVAELKIDRAFVRGAADGLRDRAIVRSIASLGRELGLRVCAEGVEDAKAWELVRELGCATAQGFHIARPMPLVLLRAWLAKGLRRHA